MSFKKYVEKEIEFIRKDLETRKNHQRRYNNARGFFYEFDIRRRSSKTSWKLEYILRKFEEKNIFLYKNKHRIVDLNNIKYNETLILIFQTKKEMINQLENDHAGIIPVIKGKNPKGLRKHQLDALKKLNNEVAKSNGYFSGLIVLPTGGGKTFTAVHWLLENYINNGKKVLWIAHRHRLLDQARDTFHYAAYSNILPKRDSFKFRVISGNHDKASFINNDEDVIIASKDSLNRNLKYLNQWLDTTSEVILIIDEAHHATAKTYRTIINAIKENETIKDFKLIGLTATPTRTSVNEQGLLKKIFADDIIYKIDLKTLISRGFLSEPIFSEVSTEFDMSDVLSDDIIDKIKFFDITSIGDKVANEIGNNSFRNSAIVNHYIQNQNKYGQTLVFALNVTNAIALAGLFNEKKIKADYVVSNTRDAYTHASKSNKDNDEAIKKFEKKELNVLINVNILTEGTDIPNIQSVFLTRPTISTILMTQMIGRGLRGVHSGGTKQTYIVSFVDEWKDQISWVNPEKLIAREYVNFEDNTKEYEKKLMRLVSIEKIQEFANILNETISTDELEKLDFTERIPIGLYSFSLLTPVMDKEGKKIDEHEKHCEVLIYNHNVLQYSDCIEYIHKLSEKEDIENKIGELVHYSEKTFFKNIDTVLGDRKKNLKDIINFISYYGVPPKLIRFEDRELYDVSKLGKEIYDKKLIYEEIDEYIDKVWESSEVEWKAFFGYDKKYFINEIDLAIKKIRRPEFYKVSSEKSMIDFEKRDRSTFSLGELKEKDYEYYSYIRDTVFENAKDKDGYYVCAKSGFKSKNKVRFHIDHIIPRKEKGLTVLENLQLLERKENWKKSDKIE